MTLTDDVRRWIADEVDPAAAAQLQALLDAGAVQELADRFAAPLVFGTAGLRGPIRAGPNGMNRSVVRRTAAGLVAWLLRHGHDSAPIVIGYDARHGSADFAADSAAIFAAAGFDARLLPGPLPTPVLAFAVQQLRACAGVMVTASHNPPQDNGYKIYTGDGAQLLPPADTEIEQAIAAVGSTRAIALDSARVTAVDDSLRAAYVDAVVRLVPADGPRELRIVHTAMHGVGTETLLAVFAAAGFTDLTPVAEQRLPDPDFPTVSFPNPEEPGALDLALAAAHANESDLVLANDPDADRCAAAVPLADSTWRMLRGDEVGVLLADDLMRAGVRGTYATTIVSSSMLGALTRKRSLGYAETLTGFKWIARAAPDLVYGYEEALGYAVAPNLVRDKDGISAALRLAALAAQLRADGSSLLQRLDELAAEVGRYATDQLSLRVDDLAIITATMQRIRRNPPRTLLGAAVIVDDLLPDADVLRWRWEGEPSGRVVVRPSGTEAKLKAYLEIVEPSGNASRAATALGRLRHKVAAVLQG